MKKSKVEKKVDDRDIIAGLTWQAMEKSNIDKSFFAYITFNLMSSMLYDFLGKKKYKELVKAFLDQKEK